MNDGRTALLIRCSQDEAAAVRAQAVAERRTISGCLLSILERSLWIEEKYARGLTASFLENQARDLRLSRQAANRTAILLRCAVKEATRIRTVAHSRGMSISEFVVFSLWRHWKAVNRMHPAPSQKPQRGRPFARIDAIP